MNPALIYDIETEGLGGPFVLGAVHEVATGTTDVYRAWDRDGERTMVERLALAEGEVWAHNGGRYDHLWFLDGLEAAGMRRPIDIIANGQGMVSMLVGEARFLDSFRLFPMSLARLTGGAKHSIAHLCRCVKKCGGWCAVRRKMPRHVAREVESYCVADVEELARALDYFSARAADWGLHLGITVGSTAWRSAREELGLPRADLPVADWGWVRDGYHGGRAEVFRIRSRRGWVDDVNSMYPWALASTPLPVDFLATRYGPDARRAWHRGRPGIYHATVSVPDMFVPPLAVVTSDGQSFPWGRVSGAWPRPVLEYAESLGCRILDVHLASVFAREEKLFGPWVERLFALRMSYGKESREGRWIKWVANSLTGKLGSRNERRAVRIWPDPEDMRECECRDPGACDCGAFRPMDGGGRAWVSVIHSRTLEACAHVEWAAYLTGIAGVKLHRRLVAGGSDAVYCDTDSCWSEGHRTSDVGEELGQWEPKGQYRDFEALGPKTYHCRLAGEDTVAAKGIPHPDWETIASGRPSPLTSVRGLCRARAGQKFFETVESTRKVTPNTGRRLPGPGNTTLAPRFS